MKDTKFKPGQSGNPQGRQPGKTPAVKLREAITKSMPDIIEELVNQAKAGDVQAAKVLLDRVCPTLKPQALPVKIAANGTLTEQGEEIIKAVMTGNIAPDIGSQLITALSGQAKIVEIDELTKRVEALENKNEHT